MAITIVRCGMANDEGGGRPLQGSSCLCCIPGGMVSNEEDGVKTTIGWMGRGMLGAKMGP